MVSVEVLDHRVARNISLRREEPTRMIVGTKWHQGPGIGHTGSLYPGSLRCFFYLGYRIGHCESLGGELYRLIFPLSGGILSY